MGFFMPALKDSGYNTILIGSESPVRLDSRRIERVMRDDYQALEGLARYGLTTPESLMVQFVTDDTLIRKAVEDARRNTLAHPRYEFYSPWDFAVPLKQRVARNIEFIAELKRNAAPGFIASIGLRDQDQATRLMQALDAELAFLKGYRISLSPVSATDIFRQYDMALALAPWNDSLRSRIFLHYSKIAASQASPIARQQLMQRAFSALSGK
jgi:hypothetical protein